MRSLPAALQKALRCVASSSFGLSAPRLVRGNNVEEKAKLVIASREINEPGETETHEISYEARDAARRVHRALHSRMSERVLVPRLHAGPQVLKRELVLGAERQSIGDLARVAELHLVNVLAELGLEVRAPRVLSV